MANLWKKLKPLVSSLVMILIIFGVVLYFAPKEKQKPRIIYEENLTREIPADAVHPGELASINYVLSIPSENDKVVDTNNAELAKKYGLKTFVDGPLKLIVGKSGKVKGFDDALIGMKVGQTKEFVIAPSEPKTVYVLNTTREFRRNQNVPKRQVFPIKSFQKLFNKAPRINDVVFNKKFPWTYKVLNVSEDAVGVEAVVSENQELSLPGLEWKSSVIYVGDYDFIVRHNPKDGQIISTPMGPAVINVTVGKILVIQQNVSLNQVFTYSRDVGGVQNPHLFKIVNITGQKISIQRDDNLAEKTLRLKVSLLERAPVQKR